MTTYDSMENRRALQRSGSPTSDSCSTIFSQTPNVFCDALSVTYSPDDNPVPQLRTFLVSIGAVSRKPKKATYLYLLGDKQGMVLIFENSRFVKIEAQGNALSYLRRNDLFGDFLSILSESPHNVTRLDAAADIPEDYSSVRTRLINGFPDYQMPLGRKSVSCNEHNLTIRPDGKKTSTYYVGKRGSGKQFLRIYDKQYEVLVRTGELVSPLTRVELEVSREFKATLKDALLPTSLFYHVLSPLLFCSVPADFESWTAEAHYTWKMPSKREINPYQIMKKKISGSSDLLELVEIAQMPGSGGFDALRHLLSQYLDEASRPSSCETECTEPEQEHIEIMAPPDYVEASR